jgi:hypothetical protein
VFPFNVLRIIAIPHSCWTPDHKILAASVFKFHAKAELVPERFSPFIDHAFPFSASGFGLFLLPLGRPPSLPFTLAAAALRLLVNSPRQAGQ